MSSFAQFGAAVAVVALAIAPQVLAAFFSEPDVSESEQYDLR